MQTDELTVGGDGAERAEEMLLLALSHGVRDEFDPPTDRALERARSLLTRLVRDGVDPCVLQLDVGVDGVIECTALVDNERVVINVEPPDGRLLITTMDLGSKQVVSSTRDAEESDVVWALERAA